jgi:hypothetical protein
LGTIKFGGAEKKIFEKITLVFFFDHFRSTQAHQVRQVYAPRRPLSRAETSDRQDQKWIFGRFFSKFKKVRWYPIGGREISEPTNLIFDLFGYVTRNYLVGVIGYRLRSWVDGAIFGEFLKTWYFFDDFFDYFFRNNFFISQHRVTLFGTSTEMSKCNKCAKLRDAAITGCQSKKHLVKKIQNFITFQFFNAAKCRLVRQQTIFLGVT